MTTDTITTTPTPAGGEGNSQTAAQAFIANAQARGLSAEQIKETLARNGIGVAAPAPEAIAATLTPELAAARAQWVKYGHDPAPFDAAIAAKPAAEQPPAAREATKPDVRTATEKAYDKSLAGVAPEQYDLNGAYLGRGEHLPTGDLAALDGELRGALSAMQVPPAMGRGIAEALLDSARDIPDEGPGRALWRVEQRTILARLGGDVEQATRLAAHALAHADKATVAMLQENGALDSAAAVLQLAHQGRRLLMREQMAARRGGTSR